MNTALVTALLTRRPDMTPREAEMVAIVAYPMGANTPADIRAIAGGVDDATIAMALRAYRMGLRRGAETRSDIERRGPR